MTPNPGNTSAVDKMVREIHRAINTAIADAEDEQRATQGPPAEIPPGDWQPGDVVLDDHGHLWTRASQDDAAQGWPWAYPVHPTRIPGGRAYIPVGCVTEDEPTRPLTLLVRNGRPALDE